MTQLAQLTWAKPIHSNYGRVGGKSLLLLLGCFCSIIAHTYLPKSARSNKQRQTRADFPSRSGG